MPTHRSRRTLSIATAAIVSMALVMPVAAADQVTQVIAAGSRTASVANLALNAVPYSHTAVNSTGTMTLTAEDTTGSQAGWHVTIQSSAFVRSGGGTSIPAANFSLTSAAAPTVNAGQAVVPLLGPDVPSTSPVGTLDSARETLEAEALSGDGNYSQALGVSLAIPARTAVGTYTGTLTTTITAGP